MTGWPLPSRLMSASPPREPVRPSSLPTGRAGLYQRRISTCSCDHLVSPGCPAATSVVVRRDFLYLAKTKRPERGEGGGCRLPSMPPFRPSRSPHVSQPPPHPSKKCPAPASGAAFARPYHPAKNPCGIVRPPRGRRTGSTRLVTRVDASTFSRTGLLPPAYLGDRRRREHVRRARPTSLITVNGGVIVGTGQWPITGN